MSDLARQQCFRHPGREAVVRCPSCRRDFCRECVTEHDERYLCSSCLAEERSRKPKAYRRVPVGPILAVIGLLTAWCVYYGATWYMVVRGSADHSYRIWHSR